MSEYRVGAGRTLVEEDERERGGVWKGSSGRWEGKRDEGGR